MAAGMLSWADKYAYTWFEFASRCPCQDGQRRMSPYARRLRVPGWRPWPRYVVTIPAIIGPGPRCRDVLTPGNHGAPRAFLHRYRIC